MPKTVSKKKKEPIGLQIKNYFKYFFRYNTPNKPPRIWELDILRGFLLIAITIDHLCFFIADLDLFAFQTEFGMKIKEITTLYAESDFRHAVNPLGLYFICLLSGINCSFTRSSWKRVLKFWIFCGVFMGGYEILHLFVFPEYLTGTIIFNIIAVLTICFTVWWLMDLIKCPTWVRTGLAIALLMVGMAYYYKYYVRSNADIENTFLCLLVYNRHGFDLSQNNFEPLLPHLSFFLIGGVLGKYLYPQRKTLCKTEVPPKALTPMLLFGKHSLVTYLFLPTILLPLVFGIMKLVQLFL